MRIFPKCPYCSEGTHRDEETCGAMHGSSDLTCEKCGKRFIMDWHLDVTKAYIKLADQ